jgi:hypothetical protein
VEVRWKRRKVVQLRHCAYGGAMAHSQRFQARSVQSISALVVALSLTVVAARQHHLNGFAIHMLRSILYKGVGLVEHIARLGAYHQSWVLLVA